MAMWNEGPWQMMSHAGKPSFAISRCMKNPTDFCLEQMDSAVHLVGWQQSLMASPKFSN